MHVSDETTANVTDAPEGADAPEQPQPDAPDATQAMEPLDDADVDELAADEAAETAAEAVPDADVTQLMETVDAGNEFASANLTQAMEPVDAEPAAADAAGADDADATQLMEPVGEGDAPTADDADTTQLMEPLGAEGQADAGEELLAADATQVLSAGVADGVGAEVADATQAIDGSDVPAPDGAAAGFDAFAPRDDFEPDELDEPAAARDADGQPLNEVAAASAAADAEAAARAAGKKRHRPVRAVLTAFTAVIAVLVIAYVAGAAVFSQLYYPSMSIMGQDVSLMSASAAADVLSETSADYTLSVSTGEFEWSCTAADISFEVDTTTVAEDALDANDALRWPVHLYATVVKSVKRTYTPDASTGYPVTYDADALSASLEEAIEAYNAERSGTFDIDSAYDEESGTLTLAAAQANRHIDADAVEALVVSALANLEADIELGDDIYFELLEGVTDEELQAACDAVNTLIAADLELTMGGSVVATLDSATLLEWVAFDDALSPTLDEDSLETWASELAETLTTVGTERTFLGSAGDEVTIGGGTYGWEVDADELIAAVQEAVAAGQTGELAVPTVSEGSVYTAAGEADWGAYAEVDISEQHAWYYDADGNLVWESGVITGNPNKGNDTPTGVYKVNAKYTNITLRGGYDSETGEYGWETPVTYWMAFVGSSVGFHDATWQASSSFSNSSAYLSVGSHGCVNLPYDAAEELYNVIQVGDCVIVHE